MARPRLVIDSLEDAIWDQGWQADEVYNYLAFLEQKEERLNQIEAHLNRAEDIGNQAVVDYFKEFKTQ